MTLRCSIAGILLLTAPAGGMAQEWSEAENVERIAISAVAQVRAISGETVLDHRRSATNGRPATRSKAHIVNLLEALRTTSPVAHVRFCGAELPAVECYANAKWVIYVEEPKLSGDSAIVGVTLYERGLRSPAVSWYQVIVRRAAGRWEAVSTKLMSRT